MDQKSIADLFAQPQSQINTVAEQTSDLKRLLKLFHWSLANLMQKSASFGNIFTSYKV